jgi:hypothetical protein
MPEKFYEIDTCDQFHKTFFCITYSAIGILPCDITQVMPLGLPIMLEKFYEIDTCDQFHKTFCHNLYCYWHIALRFISGFAARVVNYA